MNTDRIDTVIDVPRMRRSRASVIGTGGSAGLCRHLLRCGLGAIDLLDRDTVEDVNLCRQEHMADQVGMTKVEALAAELRRINPAAEVRTHHRDVTALPDAEADALFGGSDLLIAATDSHAAQARVNELALRLGVPAVFIGVYEGGAAGEVFFWHPGLASCYRCVCAARYAAQASSAADPPSGGATTLDVTFVDAIAGMIAVGLLTRGADNRYGRLIESLGERQFLQVQLDPAWRFGGRELIREVLGVPAGNDAFVSFCTAACRDPDPGGQCPDCVRFRHTPSGAAP